LGRKGAYLHLEKPKLPEVFLLKENQFSQGNNILDSPAFNMIGLLWTDICVSSNQQNRPIWNKHSLSEP
jgi:hypothetical protein